MNFLLIRNISATSIVFIVSFTLLFAMLHANAYSTCEHLKKDFPFCHVSNSLSEAMLHGIFLSAFGATIFTIIGASNFNAVWKDKPKRFAKQPIMSLL